jgi:hypothetical protein
MKSSIRLSFLVLLYCLPLFCQTENASISGRVTDPSGSAVIDAGVSVTNVDTGMSLAMKTNGAGFYIATGLHPGKYRVTVTKQGFQTVNLTGIELNVQDYLSKNVELKVGSVSEQVTVVANALNLNTTDASVSTVVDQTYVKNMPLNGRSFQDLILLTPGVVTQTPQTPGTRGTTGEFSVNGQRTEENYYTVDGVSANVGAAAGLINGYSNTSGAGASGSVAASTSLGTTQALVSVDDLQEFRVQSSSYSAEYGRNPGGQFAFETKSGSNQWHGTAYDYLRNGFFDAQDWFNDYLGTPNGALRQNDFGGTIGAPIKKDRTFFFVSYEGLRLTAPVPATTTIFVPDLALRASADPAVQPAMNAYPLPTPRGFDNPVDNTAQYIASWSTPSSINSVSARVDQIVSDKLRLFFRFSHTGSDAASRGNTGVGYSPSVNQNIGSTVRTYTAGATSLISSRLSNDFRLNYTTNEVTGESRIDPIGGSLPIDLLGRSALGIGSEAAFCYYNIAGNCLGLDQGQWSAAQKQWNLVDTLSLSLGRHQFKFGLDYRRLTPNAIVATPSAGYLFFDQTAVQTNGGFVTVNAFDPAYPVYTNFSAFAEDQWRASQRLTLSMGLRWEVNPPPGVTRGLMPYTLEGSDVNTMKIADQGTPLWKTTWFNFAPRLGVAYVIRDKQGWETVLRGGVGVFFDSGNQTGSLGFSGPGFASFNFAVAPFPTSAPSLVIPIQNPPNPPYTPPPVGYYSHLQLPYTLNWNASFEQALGRSQVVTASYVANHASRLLQTNIFLPPSNPNTFVLTLVSNGSTSDYESFQLQYTRRLSKGLTALGAYTWSHCLDYGTLNSKYGYVRGDCDVDVRHNFSAAFSYDVPNVGHSGLASALLHHWGIDDRFIVRSAFPVAILGQGLFDPNAGKLFDEGVDLVPGQPIYLSGAQCDAVYATDFGATLPCPGGRAINPNAFEAIASGQGNTPRNSIRGFGEWQMNLAIRREFPITERAKLQFRAEGFNIFNHPNFGVVVGRCGGTPGTPGCTTPTFGQATATLAGSQNVLSPLYASGGPRSMQFALKLVF